MLRFVSHGSEVGYSGCRATAHANVAQLVERNLAKVEVESSSLLSRSTFQQRHPRGPTGPFFRFCPIAVPECHDDGPFFGKA